MKEARYKKRGWKAFEKVIVRPGIQGAKEVECVLVGIDFEYGTLKLRKLVGVDMPDWDRTFWVHYIDVEMPPRKKLKKG